MSVCPLSFVILNFINYWNGYSSFLWAFINVLYPLFILSFSTFPSLCVGVVGPFFFFNPVRVTVF